MELKLNKGVKAAVQINNQNFISLEESIVYESIEYNEAYIFIATSDGKQIKIRFVKEVEHVANEEVKEEAKEETKTE